MKVLSLKRISAFALAMFLFAACSSLAPLAPPSPTPLPSAAATGPTATATAEAPDVNPGVVGTSVVITVVPLSGTPFAQPTAQLTPSATIPAATKLLIAESKYRLLDKFGTLFFCDPDSYPVARIITDQLIAQRVAEIRKDTETYQTILKHLGLTGVSSLSIEQNRMVYDEYKKLNAIFLEPAGDKFGFDLRDLEANAVFAIQGTIDASGNIAITSKQPGSRNCPICLDGDTLIDTPNGMMRVRDLVNGMQVWTADANGARRASLILATVERDLPFAHILWHVALEDGRQVTVSPAHPTNDGRMIGALVVGDNLDGSRVTRIETIWRNEGATYDILPAGTTGTYWANGILLRSTLAP